MNADHLRNTRDRALLLLGFAGCLRASELTALQVSDVEITADGALVHIRHAKADQEGAGATVAVPHGQRGLCPVSALQAWLEASGAAEGPIFRRILPDGALGGALNGDNAVTRIVQARAKAAGLERWRDYTSHSLRAGGITEAAAAGADVWLLQEHARHADPKMTSRYVRRADRFTKNAMKGVL